MRRRLRCLCTDRQTLHAQSELVADLPEKPSFFETPTSAAITRYLQWAQRGRLVLIVTGAGLGKTETAKNFLREHPDMAASIEQRIRGQAVVLSEKMLSGDVSEEEEKAAAE